MSERMAGTSAEPFPPRRRLYAVMVWAFTLLVLAFVRYRADWSHYVALHRVLAEFGVPEWVRRLDSPLIMLGAPIAVALVTRAITGFRIRDSLALRSPGQGWVLTTALASAPMLLGGLALMLARGMTPVWPDVYHGGVLAPVVEEVFFRSLLVALPVALLAGRAFWRLAVAGGLVFGLAHIPWATEGLVTGWSTVLVTGIGGVWFAWLMRAWGSVLVPVLLHACMNLGWMIAGSHGAAGGGLSENLFRVATIATATVLTIRLTSPASMSKSDTRAYSQRC